VVLSDFENSVADFAAVAVDTVDSTGQPDTAADTLVVGLVDAVVGFADFDRLAVAVDSVVDRADIVNFVVVDTVD